MTELQDIASVSVVIPSYNMDWCIARAVRSCQSQSFPICEIIVVDDCSSDATPLIVAELTRIDSRVKYIRSERNRGHLASLRTGTCQAASDWIALLDADDELTSESIAARVFAATRYSEKFGLVPQLVYGDHFSEARGAVTYFPRLQGMQFPFLVRELCLCQTSTIMLGRKCLPYFPISNNPWNTDDEIVLAIGKRFPILHSGEVVAIYHAHSSLARMGNSAVRRFRGVSQLVRDHRNDIVGVHGIRCLLLWYLRVLKVFLEYKINATDELLHLPASVLMKPWCFLLRAYRNSLLQLHRVLHVCVQPYFTLEWASLVQLESRDTRDQSTDNSKHSNGL